MVLSSFENYETRRETNEKASGQQDTVKEESYNRTTNTRYFIAFNKNTYISSSANRYLARKDP